MHYFKALALILCILSTTAAALAIDTDKNMLNHPDLEHIEIDDGKSTTRVAAPLTSIKVCGHSSLGGCTKIDDPFSFSWNLAYIIKSQSRFQDCYPITSGLNNNKFKYTYYATGRNCRTTAREETIAGAIHKYLDKVAQNSICGTVCLKLNHEGTWDGWLKVGEWKNFNEKAYCGDRTHFDKCSSGGTDDI